MKHEMRRKRKDIEDKPQNERQNVNTSKIIKWGEKSMVTLCIIEAEAKC